MTATRTLQWHIDRAAAIAATGQYDFGFTVCLAPGQYPLPGSLRLDKRHGGMTLECCGGYALLVPDPDANRNDLADGMLIVGQATDVTLRGLAFLAIPTVVVAANAQRLGKLPADMAGRLGAQNLALGFAVRAFRAGNLTLDDCVVEMFPQGHDNPTIFIQAAVFAQGDCPGLTVRGCKFMSSNPTRTPIPGRGAAPTASSIVITAGVLAPGSIRAADGTQTTTMGCQLGDAEIQETEFSSLTFASWISATADTLRVRDNKVREGVAGFWMEAPDAAGRNLTNANPGAARYYPGILQFAEFVLLRAFAENCPPPAGSDTPGETPPSAVALHAVFVTGNDVEMRDSTEVSAALFLALVEPSFNTLANAASQSVILSNNRLQSRGATTGPVAMVVMPALMPCAINGNIVLNLGLPHRRSGRRPAAQAAAPSLWLAVDHFSPKSDQPGQAPLFAAAGNVLHGPSNLTEITRPIIGSPDTWSPYNADQL